jgi:hypothetical protein
MQPLGTGFENFTESDTSIRNESRENNVALMRTKGRFQKQK